MPHADADRTIRSIFRRQAAEPAATIISGLVRVGIQEEYFQCQTSSSWELEWLAFGAAHRLHAEGITPVMYDKNAYHGGHTASFRYDSGFLFDLGPHISFTKDPRIQDLFADSVDQQYETVQINLNNYWRGYWPQHPVQLHLHGLPEETVVKVITRLRGGAPGAGAAGEELRRLAAGELRPTFAELFPHAVHAQVPHHDGRKHEHRLARTAHLSPQPGRSAARRASPSSAPHVHYITHFRYPSDGGFVSYLKKFVPLGNLKLNHELVSVDPRAGHLLRSRTASSRRYDGLVSSVPLPDLIRMIEGAPPDVLDASQRLACSTCVLVNIGVNREDLSNAHMTLLLRRGYLLHAARLSRTCFPPRTSQPAPGAFRRKSTFSDKYKPFTGRRRTGSSRSSTGSPALWLIARRRSDPVPQGDVAALRQHHLRSRSGGALKTVHGYLDDLGIAYCGRYGDWGYMWTDESFKSGELAAEGALELKEKKAAHHN